MIKPSSAGIVFHAVNRATEGQLLFRDHGEYLAFHHLLAQALVARPIRLLAYCLMPNHWHGVVELEDDSLASVVRKMKANSARVVRSNSPGTISKVWADAFHDHALREDEGLVDMARYVVLNPVRAGLVRRIRDYPYWDAIWK